MELRMREKRREMRFKREGRGLLTGEKESGMLTCGGGGAALHNSFKTSPRDIFCLSIGVIW